MSANSKMSARRHFVGWQLLLLNRCDLSGLEVEVLPSLRLTTWGEVKRSTGIVGRPTI